MITQAVASLIRRLRFAAFAGALAVALAVLILAALTAPAARAADCGPMLDTFNAAVDAAQEKEAQAAIDKIARSAECGQLQSQTQRRLAALRLSAAQILMARGRPVQDYDRLLIAAEMTEVLWQASATLGEVRFGERRFADAARAYDNAIEIVKNETLTPLKPEIFELEGLISRSAQARLLAASIKTADGQTRFVQTARDQRDGTLGGIYSRSLRGIMPQVIPLPITFEYAKTEFTGIGQQAAQELAQALKEQRVTHVKLIGHTDIRGNPDTNLKLSAQRAEAVAAYLRNAGLTVTIDTLGAGSNQPLKLSDSSGLSQDDIHALNRRVEFIRD